MPTFSGQIKSRPTRKEGKGPSGRRKIRSTSWTIKQDNMAKEGHSSGWCILKRGYGIMDNTQQASFYSTLSDSRQTASHQETAASENGYKYFWAVLWGEKSQPSSSLLWLSRREMAAFGALSLYNWTLLKGQHAGNGSPFCSFHVSLLAWEGSTPTPDILLENTPRAKATSCAEHAGGGGLADGQSKSAVSQGKWAPLVTCPRAGDRT